MPRYSTEPDISSIETDHRKPLLLGTLQQLQWSLLYVTEDSLVAHTKRSAWKWEQEITIVLQENSMQLTSSTIHGEVMDIKKRNQKNIEAFTQAFEQLSKSYQPDDIEKWKHQLEQSEEAQRMTQEQIAQVMTGEPRQPVITYSLVAINVLVFLLMVVKGVNFFEPTAQQILDWGGNMSSRTLSGEWWRLFSSIFVHIGIVHLFVNMLSLFMAGIYLESLLGRWRFLLAYVCTGVFASLASIWWHDPPLISAGASGAIFGMFGVFLALLTTRLLPSSIRNQLLGSIGIMVVYNLVYGLKAGVDNAAHIGGLISGLLIGYGFYFSLRPRSDEKPRTRIPELLILACTVITTVAYLNVNKRSVVRDDSEAFIKKMEHFSILESMAIEAMQPSDTASQESILTGLRKTALSNWADCVNLMDETDEMVLPENLVYTRTQLKQYAQQRVQQTLLFIKAVEEDTDRYDNTLDSLLNEIEQTINNLKETMQPPASSGGSNKL